MIAQSTEFQKREFRRISVFSSTDLRSYFDPQVTFLKSISSDITDTTKIVQVCCLADFLRKATEGNNAPIVAAFDRLRIDQNLQLAVFSFYVRCKLYKKLERPQFLSVLDSCERVFRDRRLSDQWISHSHFLKFLSQFCVKLIRTSTSRFVEVVRGCLLLGEPLPRRVACDALSNVVKVLKTGPDRTIRGVLDTMWRDAGSMSDIHASLLIYLVLLQNGYPIDQDAFTVLVARLRQILHTGSYALSSLAVECGLLAAVRLPRPAGPRPSCVHVAAFSRLCRSLSAGPRSANSVRPHSPP
jgi:hypothetical protein